MTTQNNKLVPKPIPFLTNTPEVSTDVLENLRKNIITCTNNMNNIIKKDCSTATRKKLWSLWKQQLVIIMECYIQKKSYIAGVTAMLDLNAEVWDICKNNLTDHQKGQIMELNRYILAYEDLLNIIFDLLVPLSVQLNKIKDI